jgi:hypothetical protein
MIFSENFLSMENFLEWKWAFTDRKLCSNKFTWCFHKQNYYMFYRHANVQRTYFSIVYEAMLTFKNAVNSTTFTLWNIVKNMTF